MQTGAGRDLCIFLQPFLVNVKILLGVKTKKILTGVKITVSQAEMYRNNFECNVYSRA